MLKKFALLAVLAALIGCAISYRSYKEGNIPVYKLRDRQEVLCYLQTGDSIRIVKSADTLSLLSVVDGRCSKWGCSDTKPACMGWVLNTMLDSLAYKPPGKSPSGSVY